MTPSSKHGATSKLIEGAGTSYGVDKLEFKFRVDPDSFDPTPEAWDKVRSAEIQGIESRIYNLNGRRRGDFPFHLAVYAEPRWQAQVTMFNPSRLLDPLGTTLCDPADLARVTGSFVSALHNNLGPLTEAGETTDGMSPAQLAAEFRISRLDIARDFVTNSTDRWRVHAATIRVPNWKTSITGVRNGVPGTVQIGNKRDFVRLYDKHRQTHGSVPPGTLRWEVQACQAWLKEANITNVASATPEAIASLAFEKWERMRLDDGIRDGRTYQAVRGLGLAPDNALTLIGWLQATADGQSMGLSARTASKYTRLAAQAGLTVGEPVTSAGGRVRWLDFHTGKEETAVARIRPGTTPRRPRPGK